MLTRYLPALRLHLMRRKGVGFQDAEELVNGFIADKVLEKNLCAMADKNRGKFRTFLLTALDRYVISKTRQMNAGKRRPNERIISLDGPDQPSPAAYHEHDTFEQVWARQVLVEATRRMRSTCTSEGRQDLWNIFEARVLRPLLQGDPVPPYEQLTRRLGFVSPTQACNALKTSKRWFRRALESIIAEYAGPDAGAIEAEILDLHRFLARPA